MAHLVRSLELYSSNSGVSNHAPKDAIGSNSHDWHVQPICQRPKSLSAWAARFRPDDPAKQLRPSSKLPAQSDRNQTEWKTFQTYRARSHTVNPSSTWPDPDDRTPIQAKTWGAQRKLRSWNATTRAPAGQVSAFRHEPGREKRNLI